VSYVFKTAQQALNVKDFYQSGDPDMTQAFLRAIAEADARKIDIFIPPGTWDVSEAFSDNTPTCIRFFGASGFEMFGIPGSSVIRLAAGDLGGPIRLSIVQLVGNCAQIGLRDFVIDGNNGSHTNVPVTRHFGLDIASGIDIDLDSIIVHDMAQLSGASDNTGIKIGERNFPGGSPPTGANARITARNCIAYNCDEGIYLYEQCDEFVQVIDCIAFDCFTDPFRFDAFSDWPYALIEGCFATKTGAATDPSVFRMVPIAVGFPSVQKLVIRDCSFLGSINVGDIEEYVATNNLLITASAASIFGTMNLEGVAGKGVISNNIIESPDEAGIRIVAGSGGARADHVLISNNFINARTNIAAVATGAENVTVVGNTLTKTISALVNAISYTQTTGSTTPGGEFAVLDNYFKDCFVGVLTSTSTNAAGTMGKIRIVGNEFNVTQYGVRFQKATANYIFHPIVARNNTRGENDFMFPADIDNLPNKAYVDGGNAGGLRGGTHYVSNGDPVTNALPGNQGDRCRNIDIAAAPAGALWVYEGGAWAQK